MSDYTQAQMRDPAIWLEQRQQHDLSLICKTCQHHHYKPEGSRYCVKTGLKGIAMSMCSQYRPIERVLT